MNPLLESSQEIDHGYDPWTFKEAMSDIDSGHWQDAMKSEMDSMYSNKVWALVDHLWELFPLAAWIYKWKLGVDGKVVTFKAWLVRNGYSHRQRVVYEKIFIGYDAIVYLDFISYIFILWIWDMSNGCEHNISQWWHWGRNVAAKCAYNFLEWEKYFQTPDVHLWA